MAKQKVNRTPRAKPYRVNVTEEDIRTGEPGACFRCAVSLAVQRATGDDEAMIFDDCWGGLRVVVYGRETHIPFEARGFVWNYDHETTRDHLTRKPILPDELPEGLRPFAFTLPSLNNRCWQERCYQCEELYSPKTLDDEGYCPECAAQK